MPTDLSDMTAQIIDELDPDDLPAIGSVHVRSWQSAYANVLPPDRLQEDIARALKEGWAQYRHDRNDLVLVARSAGDRTILLGFCAIWCRPEPYLDNLHVAPEAGGRGIGRALLQAAASHLVARGHTGLSLTVFQANNRARFFYARLGGLESEAPPQMVFGEIVPCVAVSWPDLATLAADGPSLCG